MIDDRMATTHAPETTSGTVTSWLPVTTAFPVVAGCESAIWGTDLAVAWDPRVGVSTLANLQCLPGAVTTWFSQPFKDVNTIFSLGPFECPESYVTTSLSAGPITTNFLCCPPDYDCGPGYCRSFASSGQVMTLYPQPSDTFTGLLTTTVSSLSTVQGIAIPAYLFGSSSTSSTSSAAGSSPASTTALSSTVASSTASSSTQTDMPNTSASAAPSSSSDLTTGAKIGIGISIPLAVIGIGALIITLFLRRRIRRQTKSANQPSRDSPPMDYRAFQKVPPTETHELSSTSHQGTHELGTEPPVAELYGNSV